MGRSLPTHPAQQFAAICQRITSKVWSAGPALIVAAATLWALDGVLRRSLFSLPAVTIVFYEHLIGGLLLAPFVIDLLRTEKMTKREWLLVGVIALLSGLIGTVFFTSALAQVNFIPFSVVFLLQKLQPLFAITSAAFLLGEKVTKKYLPWAGLALFAAYFVTFPGGAVNFSTGAGTVMAALLAFGAAAAWGTSTTFSRMLLLKISNTLATGLRFVTTAAFGLVTVLVLGQAQTLLSPTPDQFGLLMLIALSTGMIALWIYYRGLKLTEAKVSTILELTFPMLAIGIDAVLYQTWLKPSQYLAALVLMFAMYKVAKLNQAQTSS